MLKRVVQKATSGFSSSGEPSSRQKKSTPRKSPKESDTDEGPRTLRRRQPSAKDETGDESEVKKHKKIRRKPVEDETPTEDETTARRKKQEDTRRKKAGRMKREPLLEYNVIETVHSAMHGKKKKHVRQELLELFGSYDSDDRGVIDGEKFKKCITKVGIKLKKTSDVDALVKCFAIVSGRDDPEETSDDNSNAKSKATAVQVDYVTFVDFACNVRDSEKLSAVAVKLRDVIRAYDGKHDRTTTVPYSVVTDLKKLDKNKRGWIASDRFSDFMQEHERPRFRLTPKEIDALTERFEYEYDKGTLGFDYVQFARWLQPMLHLDKKQLHSRVKQLIKTAQESGGWELGELFEAMDDSGDGYVSASELKQALFDMGLPLTDAQIHCLVEEYDTNRDGKIQYEEFVSLFQAPRDKRTPRQQHRSEDESDGQKRRAKAKANVRNTFSWAINKAFARKHAQANKLAKSSSKKLESDDPTSNEKKKKRGKTKKAVHQSESESEEEKPRSSKRRSERMPSEKAQASSEELETSDESTTRKRGSKSNKSSIPRKKNTVHSSTDSEIDHKKPVRRRKGKDKDNNSSDSSLSDARQKRPTRTNVREIQGDSSKRRTHSTASQSSHRAPRSHRPRKGSRGRNMHRPTSPDGTHTSRPTRTRSQRAHLHSRQRRKRTLLTTSGDERRTGSESDRRSGGSQSGLDLDQVRELQKQPRQKQINGYRSYSDTNDTDTDDTDDVANSKSERAYFKTLKKSLRRAFDFFDNEHTETISKRNIGHVLRALGHEYSSRELDREMQLADYDQNGEMDFYEFYQLVKRQLMLKAYLLSKRREMEIRQAFQAADANRNGVLDGNEFEFLIYKVLQVELSVEEQDALLDAVESVGDGTIQEDDFIGFMKTLEGFHENGVISAKRQHQMLQNLDPVAKLACSAVKKLIRGAPMDLDKNLLSLLGVPTNFRPALTSAAVCRELYEISMQHALSFPCPETIVGLAQDPIRVTAKKEVSVLNLGRTATTNLDDDDAKLVLKQAETWQAHAIVSLKRASGVPKPFDTREEDVIKRCVHVALYQEHEDTTRRRRHRRGKDEGIGSQPWHASGGTIVGNVHEIPVFWNPSEEDVWEFSRKSTKEDKYKFVVRTNNINDRLYLLVEFIVHLRTTAKLLKKKKKNPLRISNDATEEHEMAACWCKIPIRTLLAHRLDVYRAKEKLWGGTIDAPIDIEEDEILRRRTGWRAITNAFTKPEPPSMGIKSAPIETYSEEIQTFVRKMPPLIIAPFVALPLVAEYMTTMQSSMWLKPHVMAANLCEPVLKLLPQIIDDHEALSVFRRAFDTEVNGIKNQEDRQAKFHDLVLRMWPSFLNLLGKIPQTIVQDAKAASASTRRLSILSPTANATNQAPPAKGTTNAPPPDHLERFDLLQCSAQGKLRLRNVPVAAAPFHVREVTFERLI